MTDVLKGLTVVEVGRGQAASVAGLLLAQAGASVLKFDMDQTHFTAAQDAMWNRLKRRQPYSRGAVEAALVDADALIHDLLPAEAVAQGLDARTLADSHPRLIHAAIGGWPIGHPKQDTPVRDALILAEAGLLDEQQGVSRDGPVWLRFPLGSAHAAYLAANGILARLYARRRTGRGGPVYTSLIQGALIPTALLWHRADTPSPALRFGFPKDSGATLFECRDGLWMHTMGQPIKAPSVAQALADMPAAERAERNRKYDHAVVKYIEDRGAIEAIFKTKDRQQWLEELWNSDVPVQPVMKMGELYFDEQANANGYVVDVDDPRLGRTRQPGPAMQVAPGEGPKDPEIAATDMRTPLDGVKILDIGNFLAGPLAPQLLGDLGADVIKLESASGDPLRHADWAFNGCQRNKRAIAVSLKDPASAPVLESLVGWADVVHHNQRMPAAKKLGFAYADVERMNPRAVYCHVSSYGAEGPRKDWPGYDQLFQASAGWEAANAGEGNRPMWCRFGMMDHLCALASVMATLLALLRRDGSGKGEFVAASLLGASLASVETLVLPDGSLSSFPQLDSRQMGIGPTQRLFQCADGWIAVDAPGHDAMPDDLDEAALASRAKADACSELNARGYPSAIVAQDNGPAFLADADNRAAGLVASFQHPVYGVYDQVGIAWSFGDLDVRCELPPPLLGQHSESILAELGWSKDASARLIADGVVKAA